VWRGLTTVAGSWIGGGANQTAMKEVYEVPDDVFSALVAVDVIVANIWMGCILYATGRAKAIDAWVGSDTRAISDLKRSLADYQASVARIPALKDTMTVLGVGFGITALSHAGADVLAAYSKLLLSAVSSRFNFVETLVKTAPIAFTGLAVAVAFRAKFWNIGAEGQLLAGAMAAAFIGGRTALPPWSLVPLMILCGMAAGAFWALIPAMLKTRYRVDDVVTTLMLNFIMFYTMMALVDGPWKDPLSGYPDSPDIRVEAEFPILLAGTRLHLGVLLALAAAPLV